MASVTEEAATPKVKKPNKIGQWFSDQGKKVGGMVESALDSKASNLADNLTAATTGGIKGRTGGGAADVGYGLRADEYSDAANRYQQIANKDARLQAEEDVEDVARRSGERAAGALESQAGAGAAALAKLGVEEQSRGATSQAIQAARQRSDQAAESAGKYRVAAINERSASDNEQRIKEADADQRRTDQEAMDRLIATEQNAIKGQPAPVAQTDPSTPEEAAPTPTPEPVAPTPTPEPAAPITPSATPSERTNRYASNNKNTYERMKAARSKEEVIDLFNKNNDNAIMNGLQPASDATLQQLLADLGFGG